MSFRNVFENEDKMVGKIYNILYNTKKVKTKTKTSTGWYSPNTEYKITHVDDGHYSHTPGVKTDKGFIPLKDLEISESLLSEGKIEKSLNWKEIIDRFDIIEDVITQPNNISLRIRGKKDGKFADVYVDYKSKEAAAEVFKKVSTFIGVK